MNFLFSVPALNPRQLTGPLVVETHNDDWEWYQNLARASRAPWVRWLCSGAVRHSARNLASLPVGTLMVHVSSSDAEAYRRRRPDLQHVVIENGTDLRPRRSRPRNDPDRPRVLLFVGSLSSRMNQDGLAHFASHFWPSLRSGATFRVVGSRPPKALEHWIERQGWELSADVSETDLDRLYEEAHFAVLPFAYGAGSKLKLIEACGRGVPVLTTVAGRVGFPALPAAVLVSDDPGAWSARVSGLDGWIGGNHGEEDLIQFARAFEWRVLADRLLKEVENVFSGKSCLRS
ncbi:MAG: glycosyltransferase family 4 protein [Verrucomicrobiales bacterium]|nr:glycosyltransferase family 4 protein [Verrucomicrobiales bacterium]